MAHDHRHGHAGLGGRLLIGLVINAGMPALQVAAGLSLSGSMTVSVTPGE